MADNALQHSESQDGAILTAQRYGANGVVRMVIADTGIGIKSHLKKHPKHRHVKTDKEAIETALKPFVTGTYVPKGSDVILEYENQGLGLSVVDQIAHESAGTLFVWSGNALYRSSKNAVEELPVSWPGTVISLTLPSNLTVNPTSIVQKFDSASKKAPVMLKFQ